MWGLAVWGLEFGELGWVMTLRVSYVGFRAWLVSGLGFRVCVLGVWCGCIKVPWNVERRP